MILNAVNGLHCQNIYIFPNIIELFQINGFKSSSLYYDAICKISNEVHKELKENIEWINHRALKKGNKSDKNIIICFLLFTYREHFIKYLEEFLLEKKENDEEQVRNLILNLQKILSEVPQSNNNQINLPAKASDDDNTTIEEQNIKEIKDENEIAATSSINDGDTNMIQKEQINDFSSIYISYNDGIIEKVQHEEVSIIDKQKLFEGYNIFDECKEYNEYSNFEDEYIYNSVTTAANTKIY